MVHPDLRQHPHPYGPEAPLGPEPQLSTDIGWQGGDPNPLIFAEARRGSGIEGSCRTFNGAERATAFLKWPLLKAFAETEQLSSSPLRTFSHMTVTTLCEGRQVACLCCVPILQMSKQAQDVPETCPDLHS